MSEREAHDYGTDEARSAIEMIVAERARHIAKGWTPEHDMGHVWGELPIQAAALAVSGTDASIVYTEDDTGGDLWGLAAKHRADRVRQLVIAAALLLAEIERKQRYHELYIEDRIRSGGRND